MMNNRTRDTFWLMTGLVVVLAALFALWLMLGKPGPLWLVEFDIGRVLKTLMILFVATLLIERASEVIITIWRVPGRADLEERLRRYKEDGVDIEADPNATTTVNTDPERDLARYQAGTRRLAGSLTFLMGVAAGCVGIRALNPLIDQTSFARVGQLQQSLFYWLDVAVTGALIGGGADGIHQIMLTIIGAFKKLREFLGQPADRGKNGGSPPPDGDGPDAASSPTVSDNVKKKTAGSQGGETVHGNGTVEGGGTTK